MYQAGRVAPRLGHDVTSYAAAASSARVLLLDEADRLLLFSCRDESAGITRWYAVGGGVRPGESHEQAALRELREETGLTGRIRPGGLARAALVRHSGWPHL